MFRIDENLRPLIRLPMLLGIIAAAACDGGPADSPISPTTGPAAAAAPLPQHFVGQVLSPVVGEIVTGRKGSSCAWPATAWIACQHQSGFHVGMDSYAWDMNLGNNKDAGVLVYAAAPGRVVTLKNVPLYAVVNGAWGQVLVEHVTNGRVWYTGYLHMAGIRVREGDPVNSSTPLGVVGRAKTDNEHLHFVAYEPDGKGGLVSRDHGFIARPVPKGSFTPAVLGNATAQVEPGQTASFRFRISSQDGFSGPVDLRVIGLPGNRVLPGTGFTPATVMLTPTVPGEVVLQVVTDAQSPRGTYDLRVEAVSYGGQVKSQQVRLIIGAPPQPPTALRFVQAPASTPVGQPLQPTPAVELLDGAGRRVEQSGRNVTIVLRGGPGGGLAGQTTVQTVNGVASFPGVIVSSSAAGYRLEATSPGLAATLSPAFTVTPPSDFSVACSPESRSVVQGATATYSCTATSLNGYRGTLRFTALNLPGNQVLPGTGFSPSVAQVEPGRPVTTTLTIVTNRDTRLGTANITVQADGGTVKRGRTVSLTVQPGPTPDFSLTASPVSRAVVQNQWATFDITIRSMNGWSGSMSMFVLNLPGNQVLPGTGFSPSTFSLGANGTATVRLTVATNGSTPTGSAYITVVARAGDRQRTVPLTLTVSSAPVADYVVEVSPAHRSTARGGRVDYAVTVRSINGYSGWADLFVLNLPGNRVLSGTGFTQARVWIPAGGSGFSTLTIVTDGWTPTGTAYMTVAAASGSFRRGAPASLTVW